MRAKPTLDHGLSPRGRKGGRLRKLWSLLCALLFLLVVVAVLYAAIRFLPERPVTYDTMADHFKYGSTRGDLATGFPLPIWQAMPLVCAEELEAVAGDRLAPDYRERVATYTTAEDGPAVRRALSREGYKALGFIYETNEDGGERQTPVGISQRHSLGLDRVYINCAICHVSTVRRSPDDEPQLVLGMPANLFNLYDFEHFLFRCAKNRRFFLLDLIPEIEALGVELGLVDRYLVYPLVIEGLKEVVQFLETQAGFSVRQPDWGPGRNDTFTNNKIYLYGEPWRDTMPDWWATGEVNPENLGTVDFPSIWLQGPRQERSDGRPMQLHWDGNNDRVEERNLNASLATSALPPIIDHESIECIEQWLYTLEPPPYPFPIDPELAARGAPIYASYCAGCHGATGRDFSGRYVGFVTPWVQVRTDRHRLDNYTEILAQNMGLTYAGQKRERRPHDCPGGTRFEPREGFPPSALTPRLAALEEEMNSYRYKHYRKTDGYANSPLDGIWLRAPYLHNGSVPTLRALLEPAARRPESFYRGNDLYDLVDVGFVSTVAADEQGRSYFFFETAIQGNGNQGHEGPAYGTELAPADKEALLEYLKTF